MSMCSPCPDLSSEQQPISCLTASLQLAGQERMPGFTPNNSPGSLSITGEASPSFQVLQPKTMGSDTFILWYPTYQLLEHMLASKHSQNQTLSNSFLIPLLHAPAPISLKGKAKVITIVYKTLIRLFLPDFTYSSPALLASWPFPKHMGDLLPWTLSLTISTSFRALLKHYRLHEVPLATLLKSKLQGSQLPSQSLTQDTFS